MSETIFPVRTVIQDSAGDLADVGATGALKVDGSAATQPVSGTVTANAGTGSFTVSQATAGNLNATVAGTVTANAGTGSFTVAQATAANLNVTAALAAGTNMIGKIDLSDGTNDAVIDVTASDAEPATTASLVTNARLKLFNGTTWDRVRGDITNGVDVDVTRLPSIPTGSNIIGQVQITNGTITLPIDTVHGDGESATENHLDVAAKTMGLNGAGTFDIIRANVNVNKTATYVAAQTGVALWTPAAGKAVVITNLQIQSYGTTAGTCIVWFGGAADTTYTRGTDFPIFDGEFAPSATNKPGVIHGFTPGVRGAADFVLRVTTTNAQSVTVSVWGYEI